MQNALVEHAEREGWSYEQLSLELSQIVLLANSHKIKNDDALGSNVEALRRLFPGGPGTVIRAREPLETPEILSAAQVIRHNPFKGHQRIPTGIPAIDSNTRGGLPIGSLLTLQGKPGSCKTAFAIQIAMRAARTQAAVIVGLFPDEGRMRAAVRIGQNLGLDRAKLEDGDEDTLVTLEESMTSLDFLLPDPDDAANTIEGAIAHFKKPEFAGRPFILIADSTQTALPAGFKDESPTVRVSAVMAALRRASLSLPALVINISQVNRGAYRNKKDADNIDPLAGGAESRAIEFLSELLIHLDGDADKEIKARAPKSRLGNKFACSFRFDKLTATLTEIDAETATDSDKASGEAFVKNAENSIVESLRLHPEGLLAGALLELAGKGVRRSIFFTARQNLLDRKPPVIFTETDPTNGRIVRFKRALSDD